MKRLLFLILFPLSAFAENATIKTIFEQNRTNLTPNDNDSIVCEHVATGLLRCLKTNKLVNLQETGTMRLFRAGPNIIGNIRLDMPYIFVVVVDECVRIVRELAPDGTGFYGTEKCGLGL